MRHEINCAGIYQNSHGQNHHYFMFQARIVSLLSKVGGLVSLGCCVVLFSNVPLVWLYKENSKILKVLVENVIWVIEMYVEI